MQGRSPAHDMLRHSHHVSVLSLYYLVPVSCVRLKIRLPCSPEKAFFVETAVVVIAMSVAKTR